MSSARDPSWPCLVLVTDAAPWSDARGTPGADPATLTRDLAATLAREFGDLVDVLPVPAGGGPDGFAALRAQAHQRLQKYAYVFLDVSALAEAEVVQLVNWLRVHPLQPRMLLVPLVNQVRTVDMTGAPGVYALGPWAVLRTALMSASGAGPLSVFQALDALGDDRNKRLPHEPCTRAEQHAYADLAPGLCRLRLRAQCVDEAAYAAALLRWARAVTGRRVALALAGAGAWGYAHIALIEDLTSRGVPIDIVTSTSSGTLIAAYYAALGPEGLVLVRERAARLQWSLLGATITTAAMQFTLLLDVGTCQLENLDVAFLPVTTDLTHNRAAMVVSGPLSFGARASASAPGIFGPTASGRSVFVDGAISDNLPVALAGFLGGNLVIACNPFPPGLGVRAPTVKGPFADLGKLLADLNPLSRITALERSLSLMMHAFGAREAFGDALVYEAAAEPGALRQTFNFGDARMVMEKTRASPAFRQVISAAEDRWSSLRLGRSP